MKSWINKGSINRYELRIDGKEVGVLYFNGSIYNDFTVYFDKGSSGFTFKANTVESAKKMAEIWLSNYLNKLIDMHKELISTYEHYVAELHSEDL